jgi:putative FmdB family regulatory protein
MPLYEYICPSCNTDFEKIVNQDQDVSCPECGREAKRKVSVFAAGSCSAPANSGFG